MVKWIIGLTAMSANIGCDGKVKYLGYTEATNKMHRMKRNRHVSRRNQSLNVYRCDTCHYYHIGNATGIDKFNREHYKRSRYDKRIDISSNGD